MELFTSFDFLYCSDFKFSVFKKPSFKTPLGGILTLITLALTVVTAFYFGKDLYYRTNPKLTYNKIVPETYPSFNLTKDNFLLYFQIQDGTGVPLPAEPNLYFHIYYFQAKVVNGLGNPIIYNTVYLNSTTCDLSLVSNATFYNLKKMGQFKCLNLSNPDSQMNGYQTGGYWDGEFVNYFYMELSYCQGFTNNNNGTNCTDSEQLYNFLYQGGRQITMNLFLQSGSIIEDMLYNPLKTDYSVHFYDIDVNLQTSNKATFFFEQMNLQDDKGIILPVLENLSTFSLKSESVVNVNIQGTNATENYYASVLFQTAIYFSKTTSQYTRSFMKLQDLTAQVGGFINGIIIIFQIFMKVFQNVEIKKIIINNIFDVNASSLLDKEEELSIRRIDISSSFKHSHQTVLPLTPKSKEMINLDAGHDHKLNQAVNAKPNDSVIINHIAGGSNNESNQVIEKRDEFPKSLSMKMREEEDKFEISQFDIPYLTLLKNACCKRCLNEENLKTLSLISYADNYIEKKLDIAYYLKLLINFEYLLKMILTKEERLLFNFTKKPPLKIPKSDEVSKLLDKEKKNGLEEFYKNNKKKKNLDRKKSIVNYLNPTVLDYISKDDKVVKKNNHLQIKFN